MIAKPKQIVNKADLSAYGKANPCGYPKCRFVGKIAERIDSRLACLNYI